jgi:O-acetyl-ADP-ribose deacetylase (regulator of RNase III)
MLIKIGAFNLEVIQGNIINQPDMIAIVNAANAELRPGGGVAGAIHQAAGSELEKACQPLAPIKPGEAVITDAYHLPNQYVIHCLGPIYGIDKPEDEILASCYRNSLILAENKQIHSIAFPAISTGIFGYPITLATQTALLTIYQMLPTLHYVKYIRFVLFSDVDLKIYKNELTTIISQSEDS